MGGGPADLASVGGKPARELLWRWQDGIDRRLIAVYGDAHLDEELLEPGRAERHEHPRPLGANNVGVRDARGDEGEVAGGDVDPLAVGENGELTLDDVEGLVLLVVDVQGRAAAERIVDLDLREAPARLRAARLDGDATVWGA